MAIDTDEAPRPIGVYQLGQDLAALSIDELRERIGELHSEIRRLEDAVASKTRSLDAANSIFKS